MHCLKVSGAKVMLVDEDQGCRARIEEVRERIEGELGIRIIVLDEAKRAEINAMAPERPGRKYRENVKGTSPMFLFYTRFVRSFPAYQAFEAWDIL